MEKVIIYYEGKTIEKKINDLKNNLKVANNEEKVFIEEDIKKYEYGLKSEEKILNKLKKSKIPMLILHDLNISYKEYKAQLDFVIITEKNCYILECKNLYGNIYIDDKYNFYRITNSEKNYIYSPINELNRHLDIIKEFIIDQNNFVGKIITNVAFNSYYKGVVVLTNPSTKIILNNSKSLFKGKVIKLDKIIDYIKYHEKKTRGISDSKEEMEEFANKLLSLRVDGYVNDEICETLLDFDKDMYNLDIIIKNKLKKYRYNKAQILKYKPYYIFSDKTLNEIVRKKPSDLEELKSISGISDIKIKKYGKDILKIINN